MTGPSRHVAHLRCLAVLTVSLFCASARAAPPPEPQELAEKESVEKWRRRNARHVLALYEGQSLAAAQDGSLWVWGQGPGEWVGSWPEIEVAQGTPTRVPGIRNVVSVATANDVWRSPALALLEDGTVLSWGQDNSIGQLGDGTTLNRQARAPVHGLDHVVAIAASAGFGLAVRADGTVWAWGSGGCGNLGDGTTESRSLPVQVVGLNQVVAVAANWGFSSYALRADGTLWAWGCGRRGQLGDGTRMDHHVPIQVPGLTDVVAIETRTDTVYALRADGTVWVWGIISEGQNGQMPQPGVSVQPVPIQVPGLSQVVSLAAGYAHALAVRRDGTVWEWGHDTTGQLEGGQNPIGPVRQVQGLHGVEAVAAGSPFSMALKRNGTLWTWGRNHSGGMGTGSDRRLFPSPVALSNVRAIASGPNRMLALRTDGTVWQWGVPVYYPGPTQATPVRVEGLDGVTRIAMGTSHLLALRTDGTLWAWGSNSTGQVGDGTTTTRLTPVQVANLTGVVEMSTGGNHSLALRSDGTVWSWGANYYGQLGDLTLQSRSTAAQVQGLTDVTAVFTHEGLSLALRRDGSVWWWGSARLAWRRGDRQPHAPEPVQGLTNIVKLGATDEDVFAVRSDGTVWKWTVGVPGEVNPAQQVPGFTNAVDVAGNNFFYFYQNTFPGLSFSTLQVLRADGTVWTMGDNMMGERGFPSSLLAPPGPTKVPGLTGVVSITASASHVHAVRADGTAVGWGDNASGLIGDGVPPIHFTPVRVPLPRRMSRD